MTLLAKLSAAVLFITLAVPTVLAQDKPTSPGHQRKEYKPQSESAAKTAFATVKADGAAVKKALDAKDLAGAKKLIGKDGAFKGTVSKVFSPHGNSLVILDFAPIFKEALTAVVKADNYTKFPDLNQLKDKKLLITGKFEDFRGAPQIVLDKPDQIKVIQ